MRRMTRLALLLLGVATAAACASGRAQVIEDRPALVVPPVPERSIEPQPAPPLPAVEPIPETSPVVTSSPKPRPTARNAESRPAEAKPENQPEATTAVTPPPPAPVAPLRSSSSPSGPEALKQIREIIQRTDGILSRIDYQKLGPDRRATYDGAKHFIQQCEEKIKQEDLTLALNFAKRAEEAAKSLETGR